MYANKHEFWKYFFEGNEKCHRPQAKPNKDGS